VGKGFQGNEGQARNEFTAQSMDRISEDVYNDRDILSMTHFLAMEDITPPE
jgi:hypothetical protein